MIALIDIGNTRLKWAILAGGERSPAGVATHAGATRGAIDALVDALPAGVGTALAASVAAPVLAEEVAAALRARGIDTTFVATAASRHGIRCAYADPARLGVDRWLAMIAARRMVQGPVCVIQAGTAVTFDAVAADGRHLGGLIFPGPRLMADALEQNTGQIGATEIAPAPGRDVLAATTSAAVGRGAMLALGAGLDRAVAVVRAAEGEPTVLATGGDATRLLAWLETTARFHADLVLDGLASIAGEA